jgi:predicted acyl esterase
MYDIEVWPTANRFKSGHRIRLEISSSSFPAYDRNPNTGEAFGTSANTQVADQVIYHDPWTAPSSVDSWG